MTCTRLRLKCYGTRAETRFRLSAKRTGPFKSAGASVQSTTGSRVVRISGSNAGYTVFRGSVKGTGYTLYSPVFPSLPFPCVTVCHHVSTGVYRRIRLQLRLSWSSALNGGEWLNSSSGRFTLGKELQCPLNRRLGGPQSRSGLDGFGEEKVCLPYKDLNLSS